MEDCRRLAGYKSGVRGLAVEAKVGAVGLEQHYNVKTVAEKLDMSPDWVRDTFCRVPGVVETGTTKSTRKGTGYKRKYTTLLIPESVVVRFMAQRRVIGCTK